MKWVFVALPIGFLMMLLFYYDHVLLPHHYLPAANIRHRMCPVSQLKHVNFLSRSLEVFIGISFSWAVHVLLPES